MKNIFFILGVAALAVAGFAMFKIKSIENGKEKPETNPENFGNEVEAQGGEGTQAQREGVDS